PAYQESHDLRRDDDGGGQRKKGNSGDQRAEAENVLHELRQEEEDAENRDAENEREHVSAIAVALSKNRERHERVPAARLDAHENEKEQPSEHKGCERQPVGPTIGGDVGQTVNETHHSARHGQ